MFGRKKAALNPDYDEERLRAELEEYKEVKAEREQRKASIDAVKDDIEKNGLPKVKKKPKVFEMGDEEDVKALVEPLDKSTKTTEVKVDSTGDGETDAVLTYHKKKGLLGIEDIANKAKDEDKERERIAERKPAFWDAILNYDMEERVQSDAALLSAYKGEKQEKKEDKGDGRKPQRVGMAKMRKPPKPKARRRNRYRQNILH